MKRTDIHGNNFRKAMAILMAMSVLCGCGNLSRHVATSGASAGELVWPALDAATPMHAGGTFPNRENLLNVRSGLNKQQIADLIGFPHFREGIWGVREWDYVFKFRGKHYGEVETCQFKVLYDENKLARSFYWRPDSCAKYQQPEDLPDTRAALERFTLSADALFKFDGASMSDISDEGRGDLDRLSRSIKLHGYGLRAVHILGYTDRIGGAAYNQELSRKRAYAVMDYLVAHGIPSEVVDAEGHGEEEPVIECPPSSRQQLIACLAPNRRVVVAVDAVDAVDAAALPVHDMSKASTPEAAR